MRSIVIAVAAALLASVITYLFAAGGQGAGPAEVASLQAEIADIAALVSGGSESANGSMTISVIGESEQDAWLRGTNRDGSPRPGPADDQKPLVDASNALCFLTKVRIEGMDGPEDMAQCSISVDEFTNWWQVHAIQGEGTEASVSCNARCLVWE